MLVYTTYSPTLRILVQKSFKHSYSISQLCALLVANADKVKCLGPQALLRNHKILDYSKLDAFADDKNVNEKLKFDLERGENTVGKG